VTVGRHRRHQGGSRKWLRTLLHGVHQLCRRADPAEKLLDKGRRDEWRLLEARPTRADAKAPRDGDHDLEARPAGRGYARPRDDGPARRRASVRQHVAGPLLLGRHDRRASDPLPHRAARPLLQQDWRGRLRKRHQRLRAEARHEALPRAREEPDRRHVLQPHDHGWHAAAAPRRGGLRHARPRRHVRDGLYRRNERCRDGRVPTRRRVVAGQGD
jgi:hypothetical protein